MSTGPLLSLLIGVKHSQLHASMRNAQISFYSSDYKKKKMEDRELGVVVSKLDSRSKGRGFESRLFQKYYMEMVS